VPGVRHDRPGRAKAVRDATVSALYSINLNTVLTRLLPRQELAYGMADFADLKGCGMFTYIGLTPVEAYALY